MRCFPQVICVATTHGHGMMVLRQLLEPRRERFRMEALADAAAIASHAIAVHGDSGRVFR